MKRDVFTRPLDLGNELIIDNFAGGGGTSTGLEAAFGRPVDIAINHDPEALAMHALNHPHTKHLCESVWDVDPIEITANRPVGLVWLSPDCKHFSKAKGGTPVSRHIRGLAWVTMRWAALCRPRVIMLENVEEFQTWGPLVIEPDGKMYPDPKRKGKTFNSFIRQLREHGYKVDWRELRACDNDTPTIRKRLFLVARRDGLPIVFPAPTHGEPASRAVLAGMLAPYRTAAECIDFSIRAESIFDRKKELAANTQRRIAKGMWRHVLTSAKPFIVTNTTGHASREISEPLATVATGGHHMLAQPIVAPLEVPFVAGAGGPAYSGKPTAANQPIGTLTTENHRAVVSPTLVPLRGTSEAHLGGRSIEEPTTTVSAGGTHHALVGAHLITIGYGERPGQDARAQDLRASLGTVVAANKHALVAAHITKFRADSAGSSMDEPAPTVTANSFIKRPGGSVPLGVVAAHLVHLTHHGERAGTTPAQPLPTVTGAHRGEQALVSASLIDIGHGESCSTGAKRWGSGVRSLETPLNAVTASSVPSALTSAFFEQAYGGFYDGDGRAADVPLSTITASVCHQRLTTAYLVRYNPDAQGPSSKAPRGDVQLVKVPVDCLSPEHREKARRCAALLHEHLPEQFPEATDMVLMTYDGVLWVLVDITLRMLKPRELYRAQGFPDNYIIHEIPDPKLLFKDGIQVANPLTVPRIPLSATAQIRMVGNSVAPPQAKALVLANFAHEKEIADVAA
ncbi:DNA cytosine methyltransferase [Burkholderia anthina]|uniref:DNA cytosine methyltransferase n=1 Tax=Burkholderia anthina TaxID=179879 RepID=UPI00158C51FF